MKRTIWAAAISLAAALVAAQARPAAQAAPLTEFHGFEKARPGSNDLTAKGCFLAQMRAMARKDAAGVLDACLPFPDCDYSDDTDPHRPEPGRDLLLAEMRADLSGLTVRSVRCDAGWTDSELTVSATDRLGCRRVGTYMFFWNFEERRGKVGTRWIYLKIRSWSPAGMPGDPPFAGQWVRDDYGPGGNLDATFDPDGTAFLYCHWPVVWSANARWRKLDASHLRIERNGRAETWTIRRQRYLPDGVMYAMDLVDGSGREYQLRR